MRVPSWTFDADNQHVLSQPAFFAGLHAGNAQAMAFFAQ